MKTKKPAFTIILVILLIAVLGIEILALSQISIIVAAETNRAYLRARHRNVRLSAAAYVRTHAPQLSDQPQTIDLTAVHPQSTCTITALPTTVQIQTTCTYRTATTTRTFTIASQTTPCP